MRIKIVFGDELKKKSNDGTCGMEKNGSNQTPQLSANGVKVKNFILKSNLSATHTGQRFSGGQYDNTFPNEKALRICKAQT